MNQVINGRVLPWFVDDFRRCMVDMDADGIVEIWKKLYPNLPPPETREDAELALHMARTASESIPLRFRAYSHRWLTERKLPSQLPDDLKPQAERMYPRIVSAVGICIATITNQKTDYHLHVTKALCEVVENFYADGIEDPVPIKAQMKVVHDRLRKQR